MSTYSSADEQLHSGWTPPPSRGPIESVVFGLKNIQFRGRASRSEFWWMFAGSYLPALGYGLVDLLFLVFSTRYPGILFVMIFSLLYLWFLFALLAAMARRLHDLDIVGWWVLIPFGLTLYLLVADWFYVVDSYPWAVLVPAGLGGLFYVVGIFVLAKRGTPGPNRFG